MPVAPPKVCAWAGCGRTTHARFCEVHAASARSEERKQSDQKRGSSSARMYGARWQKLRVDYLRAHPLCAECERNGRVTPATMVDHIIPHRGDPKLFWDKNNRQGLCDTCSNSYKQRLEKSGVVTGCDINGTLIADIR